MNYFIALTLHLNLGKDLIYILLYTPFMQYQKQTNAWRTRWSMVAIYRLVFHPFNKWKSDSVPQISHYEK